MRASAGWPFRTGRLFVNDFLVLRVAAGDTRQGLILWRSPLRCDFAAMFGLGPAS